MSGTSEQLSVRSKDIDKRFGIDTRVTALVAAIAALTTVNAAVVATRFEREAQSTASADTIDDAVTVHARLQAIHVAAEKRAIARASYIKQLAAKVPAATYAAALLSSPSDLVKAEHRIIAMGLPPVPVENAINIAKPLKMVYSLEQQQEAETVVDHWIDLAQANKVSVNLERSTGNIFKTFTLNQEATARTRIASVMDDEMARNVREIPAGSNLGPRIDYYLGYHIIRPEQPVGQKWCAAFVSTVYMLSGIPLNGGHKYSRKTPDYLLTRAAEPTNPAESPRIPSVSDWFKENAYHFKNGERVPAVGDAVFMRSFTSKNKPFWHTGLVRGITENGSLITYEGNANNALIKKVYPNYRQNDYIYSFGSLFPDEQTPQAVPVSPLLKHPVESTPLEAPEPVQLEQLAPELEAVVIK